MMVVQDTNLTKKLKATQEGNLRSKNQTKIEDTLLMTVVQDANLTKKLKAKQEGNLLSKNQTTVGDPNPKTTMMAESNARKCKLEHGKQTTIRKARWAPF